MMPPNSSMPKIAAATAGLIEAMRQAALKKEAFKLARTACKTADRECKQARKASRKAAKLARRAKQKLEKLHRKIKKSKVRADEKIVLSAEMAPPSRAGEASQVL
jgi:hypothetical protein